MGDIKQVEAEGLLAVGGKENGDGLYAGAGSCACYGGGWDGQLFESGGFAMRRSDYLAMGGYDGRFQSPGGGLANLDIFQRALIRPDLKYVALLGEGTFHQVHGGVSTSTPMDQHPWKKFNEEFTQIRGSPFARVPRKPYFLGEMPDEASYAAEFSRKAGAEMWRTARLRISN